MIDLLLPRFSKPIEREYEGWLVRAIEKYFQDLGIFAVMWAVSPTFESSWPADEHLYTSGKIIGLQIKKATLSNRKNPNYDFTDLKWNLHDPRRQFELIQKRSEIYYCLPTFINRKWKDKALEHCIFWRPEKHIEYYPWYNNPRAKNNLYSSISNHPNTLRWGHFYEKVIACEIGKRLNTDYTPYNYLDNLQTSIYEELEELRFDEQGAENITKGLYLIYLNI